MNLPSGVLYPSKAAIDRAAIELRRDRMVVVHAPRQSPLLVQAAECVTDDSLELIARLSGVSPKAWITRHRAAALGLLPAQAAAVASVEATLSVALVSFLTEARAVAGHAGTDRDMKLTCEPVVTGSCAHGAVHLAKVARLFPAVVGAPLALDGVDALAAWARDHDFLIAGADAALAHQGDADWGLRLVVEARVPLLKAEHTRLVVFRPADGGDEHIAIVIGDPKPPVLTRLHSECFTGDLLRSLRCDCGDQLRGAVEKIAEHGSGVILYLPQEGRNIGLSNKLRAYTLQDQGIDTMEANQLLGFEDDERTFAPAAEMLRLMGFTRVRLMSNNPGKLDALARHGIEVEERVAHAFEPHDHNRSYIMTKKVKGGHLL